jgi:hypothetical protein
MIGNIPELQEVTWSEVVVGEDGIAAFEFLGAVSFAIHIAIQWISFESIAKCSIANEIVKSTNLKDRLLLSQGLSIEVILLPHCFVLPSHFFVPLPQTLLKHFNLESVFRAVRDEGTPWALRRWHCLLSSHLPGVDYAKTKEQNGTIGSPSMALSPSASVQGHQVDVLLSPIDPPHPSP